MAAYLTLKGPEGMPLVEDLFLKNQDAEYTDTYATIMALRFHGTEEKIIPKDRLLVGLRMMLDRPQLADLVIPDLCWEDWSVIDRLVELFKKSDEESSWVRVPVINYLRACPKPEAKERIDELAKLDPESIKRANSFFPLGAASGAATAETEKPKTDNAEEKPAATEKAEAEAAPAPAGAASSSKAPAEKKTSEKKAADPNSQSSAKPASGVRSVELSEGKPSAVLAGHLAPAAAAIPGPPVRTTPVVVGMLAAAIVLACAFWGILKGGQRSAA